MDTSEWVVNLACANCSQALAASRVTREPPVKRVSPVGGTVLPSH